MARVIAEIEKEIRSLARPEQEQLLRALLEELAGPVESDAEAAWLNEVQRRSAEFDAGFTSAIPAAEVFAHVRDQLKQ